MMFHSEITEEHRQSAGATGLSPAESGLRAIACSPVPVEHEETRALSFRTPPALRTKQNKLFCLRRTYARHSALIRAYLVCERKPQQKQSKRRKERGVQCVLRQRACAFSRSPTSEMR